MLFADVLLPLANFFDLLSRLDEDQLFALTVVTIGCSTGIIITAVIGTLSVMSRFHKRSTEGRLKREMLDRGLSAEEIATVITATSEPTSDEE